ncbi:flagellar basal body rod protein FlgB [Thiolapillus brandeum]|uniref:Flagellar basal body rod protein FlgB n=1 Tax=Thiolapillus brandeum TaxID=1076588 RepID=A0A7U6GIL8_9GAMM|nr:flagellar basal body rod protein FlgB [Thiolapillus brandeum]BAO44285.1 flagellar basal-body rod protein FlgB [Thiolapillus brandeum]
MPLSFDSALGIHARALAVRGRRTELLASNIANADTPGYKARDMDFRAVLSQAGTSIHKGMRATQKGHMVSGEDASSGPLLYRVPLHPSLDGNTVDGQLEKAAFAENALRYQASLTFLDQKFKGLIGALKGE